MDKHRSRRGAGETGAQKRINRPELIVQPDDFSEIVDYHASPPEEGQPPAPYGQEGYPAYREEDFPPYGGGAYEDFQAGPGQQEEYPEQAYPDGGSPAPAPYDGGPERPHTLPSLEPVTIRPRQRKKKIDRRTLLERRVSLLLTAVLTLSFTGAAVLMLALPRSTESKIEKRKFEPPVFSLENWFSGKFTADVNAYYTDTVPNRDGLKNVGNNFKSLFGLPQSEASVEFVGNVNKLTKNGQPAPTPEAQPAASGGESPSPGGQPVDAPVGTNTNPSLEGAAGRHMDEATPAPIDFAPPVPEEAGMTENGLIVLKLNGHYRALELFGGGGGASYIEALNSLQSQVGGSVKIWSMPAPLACEFYTPSEYADYTTSHSECFDAIAAKLDPGIQSINICPVLAQHVEEPIYCRTDHHWQPLGAYYAAQAFAGAAGVPFDELSTYKEEKIENFVGSMYAFSGSANLLNDPEDFVYYRPGKEYQAAYYDTSFDFLWDEDDFFQEGASGSDAYMVFLGGDAYIVKADTQAPTDRKLLVVKDSYGNAIPPFLTGSFKQIYVADMRYMERNLVSFIQDMGITDVLFTMSSYSLVGDAAGNLNNLLNQNAGETVTDNQPTGSEPAAE